MAAGVLKLAKELTGARVKGAHVTVTEITDQQVAAKAPKTGRGKRSSNGRIERGQGAARCGSRGKAHQEVATGIELVNEAIAGARHIVMFVRVLLGEGHEQDAIDVLYAKRSKSRR